MSLSVNNASLFARVNGQNLCAAKFSQKMIGEIQKLAERGYTPYAAKIKFIVAWKCKADKKNYPVPLVDLYFRKNQRPNT